MTSQDADNEMPETQDTKACPWCGETILAVAKKCKHCGEYLEGEAPTPSLPGFEMAPAAPERKTSVEGSSASRPAPRGNAPQIKCPHCQKTGDVSTSMVKVKKGISGGKATAAVFTAGISMLGTGLSRKERVTRAYCQNCQVGWVIG